jgi:exonuclease III
LNIEPNSENSINDFQNLVSFRHNHLSNPFFSYYNINSLRNIFFEIKDLASKVLPDILVLAETKIDSDFKDSEFILDGYYQPLRKDFSSNSGGLIQYVRNGIIHNHKPKYELSSFESLATELTFNKQKWLYLTFYRTERNQNKRENIIHFF